MDPTLKFRFGAVLPPLLNSGAVSFPVRARLVGDWRSGLEYDSQFTAA